MCSTVGVTESQDSLDLRVLGGAFSSFCFKDVWNEAAEVSLGFTGSLSHLCPPLSLYMWFWGVSGLGHKQAGLLSQGRCPGFVLVLQTLSLLAQHPLHKLSHCAVPGAM